ncbi:unnamed protein product [Ectocarpus sp. 4 AP-2014]
MLRTQRLRLTHILELLSGVALAQGENVEPGHDSEGPLPEFLHAHGPDAAALAPIPSPVLLTNHVGGHEELVRPVAVAFPSLVDEPVVLSSMEPVSVHSPGDGVGGYGGYYGDFRQRCLAGLCFQLLGFWDGRHRWRKLLVQIHARGIL